MQVDTVNIDLYEPRQVSRLLHVRHEKMRRWIYGQKGSYTRSGKSIPVNNRSVLYKFFTNNDRPERISFLSLVELFLVKGFVNSSISLHSIRKCAQEAARLLETEHPFAIQKIRTDGAKIFLECLDENEKKAFLQLGTRGQWALPKVIEGYLDQIDFDFNTHHAYRWWPLGRDRNVCIDPRYAIGAPVVADSHVPIAAIFDYYVAESYSIDETASWFSISRQDTRDAVEFEEQRRAA